MTSKLDLMALRVLNTNIVYVSSEQLAERFHVGHGNVIEAVESIISSGLLSPENFKIHVYGKRDPKNPIRYLIAEEGIYAVTSILDMVYEDKSDVLIGILNRTLAFKQQLKAGSDKFPDDHDFAKDEEELNRDMDDDTEDNDTEDNDTEDSEVENSDDDDDKKNFDEDDIVDDGCPYVLEAEMILNEEAEEAIAEAEGMFGRKVKNVKDFVMGFRTAVVQSMGRKSNKN